MCNSVNDLEAVGYDVEADYTTIEIGVISCRKMLFIPASYDWETIQYVAEQYDTTPF